MIDSNFNVVEMKCKENSRYEFSSKCPATCENKSPTDDDCDLPALEGCVCNEGYFLDDKECVEESKCGCIADDEEYYKVVINIFLTTLNENSYFYSDDCLLYHRLICLIFCKISEIRLRLYYEMTKIYCLHLE